MHLVGSRLIPNSNLCEIHTFVKHKKNGEGEQIYYFKNSEKGGQISHLLREKGRVEFFLMLINGGSP